MIKTAVIGAGWAGGKHARAYASIKGVQVGYIFDADMKKAEALAREDGAACVWDVEDIFLDPTVEVVSVTVPTPFHTEYAIRSLEAGKHVVVEKPLAFSLEEIDRMITTADKAGKFLMTGHILRFCPEYTAIRSIMQNGRLGRPLLVTCQRLSGVPRQKRLLDPAMTGGAVIDLQIHDLDLMNWLFGEPVSVVSSGIQGEFGGWDHVMSQVEYREVRTFVEASFLMPPEYPFTVRLKVVCERGMVEYESRGQSQFMYMYETGRPPEKVVIEQQDGFRNELSYFIQCIRDNAAPQIITPADARLAVRTALASKESLQGKKTIHLENLP